MRSIGRARALLKRGAIVGLPRYASQTTTQEPPCLRPQPAVTICVLALLKLARWCQQRREGSSGGHSCVNQTTSPPVCFSPLQPRQDASACLAATTLDASPPRAPQAAESDCRSGHCPPQPATPWAGGVR